MFRLEPKSIKKLQHIENRTKEIMQQIKDEDRGLEYILKNKILVKKLSRTIGIYFLIKDNTVVYVGKSNRCEIRVWDHFFKTVYCPYEKNFDSFSIIKVEEDLLDEVERYYIAKYNPMYNSVKYKHHMPGECARMSMWRVIK